MNRRASFILYSCLVLLASLSLWKPATAMLTVAQLVPVHASISQESPEDHGLLFPEFAYSENTEEESSAGEDGMACSYLASTLQEPPLRDQEAVFPEALTANAPPHFLLFRNLRL